MVTSKMPPTLFTFFTIIMPPSLCCLSCISHNSSTTNPYLQLFVAHVFFFISTRSPTSPVSLVPLFHILKHTDIHPHQSSVCKPLNPLNYLHPILCLCWAGMWWWHWCVFFLSPLFTNRRRPDWSMPTLRSLNRTCSLKRPKLRNSKES